MTLKEHLNLMISYSYNADIISFNKIEEDMQELLLQVKDYYSVSHYNCIDLAIANALTFCKPDLYDLYCALLGLGYNWGNVEKDENILKMLGIEEKELQCCNEEQFIDKVCRQIDKGHPAVMTPFANTVFYSIFYKRMDYPGGHGLIIYGYDEEKQIFLVKENIHVIEYNKVETKGTPFYTFALTFTLLYEIYEKSIMQLKGQAILRSYEKVGEGAITCQRDILKYFIMIDLRTDNHFIQRINEITQMEIADLYNDETLPIYIRRQYINSLQALIFIYEQYIESFVFTEHEKKEYIDAGRKFMQQRGMQVNLLMKLVMGGKFGDNSRLQRLNEDILKNDLQFQDVVRNAIQIKEPNIKLKNFALKCNVSADTYRKFPMDYPPENAVNGIWSTGNEDECWFSTAYSTEHWILFDLGQIHEIQRLILRHYEGKCGNGYLTDFVIQASEDCACFDDIVTVHDNENTLNVFEVNSIFCRWIKIVITGTANEDGLSAIREFEAWGISI